MTFDALPLRPPEQVMRLSRLGSFHQSRLSFMRSLLRFLQQNQWTFSREIWRIDAQGVGVACYQAQGGNECYSLVCFAHKIEDSQRSDRVISEVWDATFVLYQGIASEAEVERLSGQVPRQEAGRFLASELILSRANKSVRTFDYVVGCLANGQQPEQERINQTGYLMRTSAVYGNGKMGIADKDRLDFGETIPGAFRAELLTVWLIRAFTLDYVEQIARNQSPDAVTLEPKIRHSFGIGNSTGLGMAPFLINHPALLHHWIYARETALARVRAIRSQTDDSFHQFQFYVQSAYNAVCRWHTSCTRQARNIVHLKRDLVQLLRYPLARFKNEKLPWNALYQWGELQLSLEGQELLVSLLLEPHADIVDDLTATMSVDEDESFTIDGSMSVAEMIAIIKEHYSWVLEIDFNQHQEHYFFWYTSAEKAEPRLGVRGEEPGEHLEQPLTIGRDIARFHSDLRSVNAAQSLAEFLLIHPEHRHISRRTQRLLAYPYAEIRDNLIAQDLLAVDLLRCKLSFFGATGFDPKSDRWVRIIMFQQAPILNEIATMTDDHWIYSA